MDEQHQDKAKQPSAWAARYGHRHRWQRISDFPCGIVAPRRVRVYRRADHYRLQWWDPGVKKNVSDRVNGDFVAAIIRAREVEERLEHFKSAGPRRQRIRHRELVERFATDLQQRADAGEIDPRTVTRYVSALGHYKSFAEQPPVEAAYPSATNVNREFNLEFRKYLSELQISPNGHPATATRPMGSTAYVESVVRTMFIWAADPDRGNLMPPGFRNPFSGSRKSNSTVPDLFGEPDITVTMAAEFLSVCDGFQLPLFALFALHGLRASEPCFLFREHLTDGWLKIPCDPEIGYVTKGRRDKRAPLVEPLQRILQPPGGTPPQGVLFLRRCVLEGPEKPRLVGSSLEDIRREYQQRCRQRPHSTASDRIRIRDHVLSDAGAVSYDHIEHEFRRVARQLKWPATATLKDFRHLFASAMQNAGMPEFYRRYLMGQSPGRAAVVTYTHLNELRERYDEAVERQFKPLVAALENRRIQLGLG